jgi:hypothetical protein
MNDGPLSDGVVAKLSNMLNDLLIDDEIVPWLGSKLCFTFRRMLIQGRAALQLMAMMERFMRKRMVSQLLKWFVPLTISHTKVKTQR